MAKGTLTINSNNILPIIKKWLYSDKDIFLRELVSNSCDAINKLKVLETGGIVEKSSESYRIDIKIDKENKTITITDNGIGMTEDEVKKYIADIAFSGAEEFLKKYKTENEKDQIIGHFGLGFYSAYMVAKKVEINTQSFEKESSAVFWSCDGSADYEIEKSEKKDRGTSITLYINESENEFLSEDKINQILKKYCPYLPFPIYVNDKHINNKDPLWLKAPSECQDEDYLTFYRELYPFEPDPIFWIHLNVDYPFHLKGILYFPKLGNNFDANKNSIKLFCNRVFVSDSCKDLLPDYLIILKGAIDSNDIPLNVSRSYLQMDSTVRKLGTHISKKICDKLNNLYTSSKDNFVKAWKDIEIIIKLGILQSDDFYSKAKNFLLFKNSSNDWTTVEEYLTRHKDEYQNKVFYSHEENLHFLNLYKDKGIEVLFTNPYIDTAILNFLESKLSPLKFQRIDGDIDESILDKTKEKSILDASGRSEAANIADFIRESLSNDELEVEAKSLASNSLPAFIMLKEEERRLRDYMNLTQKGNVTFPTKKTFVVNTNSNLINKAYILRLKNKELAKDLIKQIYNLSELSQKEMDSSQISSFVTHSNKVLEKLSELNT